MDREQMDHTPPAHHPQCPWGRWPAGPGRAGGRPAQADTGSARGFNNMALLPQHLVLWFGFSWGTGSPV